ncbi:NAD(P)/FAD-dependent oxidoreductase [Enterococcus sp. 669A]|uniref:Ferredoxin--NADP reductase n=1 Tax=Candidatus Enterococcus moelleringii TaxID=2815325 RepID=A0ABS3L891_9ENTE|nr:NAD(P)/FAD-dependent oxidoreductase [Enterococcus sp. 669A]MBO1305310.1 NAD(P)/FAD-dependent oxidoreductase [Enterococcus sp. 669A]
MDIFDITIVGGGPVGMFAAFYAGIRQRKTKLIDSLPQLGGQLTTLYPEKYIYDIPGFPEVKAADLIGNLEKQLRTFTHTYCLEEEVLDLKQHEGYLELVTNKGTHYTKAVILAIGSGSFQPRRLQVKDSDVFENRGIDYYISDLMKYAGKKVAIAGGGDSAIDWALMLEPIAEKVAIIHRRSQFRGHEHSVEKLKTSTADILTPYILTGVSGDHKLNTVTLQKAKSDETMELDVDHLIVNYGFTSSLDHLKSWGLECTRQAVIVDSDMSTSIPGVYACGDITTYHGKVKLIATGAGEAPTAVNNALHYIDPEARRQPGHSTSLFPKNLG